MAADDAPAPPSGRRAQRRLALWLADVPTSSHGCLARPSYVAPGELVARWARRASSRTRIQELGFGPRRPRRARLLAAGDIETGIDDKKTVQACLPATRKASVRRAFPPSLGDGARPESWRFLVYAKTLFRFRKRPARSHIWWGSIQRAGNANRIDIQGFRPSLLGGWTEPALRPAPCSVGSFFRQPGLCDRNDPGSIHCGWENRPPAMRECAPSDC